MSSGTNTIRHHIFSTTASVLNKLKIKSLSRWELNRKHPETFFYPHLVKGEIALFYKMLEQCQVAIEYGSGGSTIRFLKHDKRLFSVESNPEFFQLMSSLPIVKTNRSTGKLDYKFIGLGPTDTWGSPSDERFKPNWHTYYDGIWEDVKRSGAKVDIVFVDGRFRVCCCLYSILMLVETGRPDSLIMIHDFWIRKEYHLILSFLDEQVSSVNLAVFRIRKGINLTEVRQALEANRENFS